MKEYFKKGQIVPKRLRMVITHRKAQANVRFGCDVIVEDRTITATSQVEKAVICAEVFKGIRRNNGTYQRVAYSFVDMKINGDGITGSTAFNIKL